MQAIRLHPNNDPGALPYSATNPAPTSALVLDFDAPIPQTQKPGELLIRVEAATVVRDALTWPESYAEEYCTLGNDFSGTVVSVHEGTEDSLCKPGDRVYGMTDASRPGTWASYARVLEEEVCLKPRTLNWAEAAAVPLSALTAYQALFDKAGVAPPDLSGSRSAGQSNEQGRRLLVTGAAGCVGLYAIQLARLAGLYVIAATRSKARDHGLLEQLGADEIVGYGELQQDSQKFDIIFDTVGGKFLESCWSLVSERGMIVSIDSASHDFVERHRKLGLLAGKDAIKALFFIVKPSRTGLQQLGKAIDLGLLRSFVARKMLLADAGKAYEYSSNAPAQRGKVVLLPQNREEK
jgi:NADPH:quinone reductase-like Zn-dependent oxidoreductase